MIKNTTNRERILRLVAGLGIAVAAFLLPSMPWSAYAAAAGLFLALTGLSGYCPMCHLAGRKEVD